MKEQLKEEGSDRYRIQILATRGPEADMPESSRNPKREKKTRLYGPKSKGKSQGESESEKRAIGFSVVGKHEAIGSS